eukprot:TRINITY_DN20563_c0_g1_i1.p1 TRINITY_DN20563_c0_g1~~TRINITY_DN20563_c0_g1_i1.p1  ORF type:complete len:414 (-),score=16.82 TRINITY_DN20563_c0_g1_i1:1593-2834(-)
MTGVMPANTNTITDPRGIQQQTARKAGWRTYLVHSHVFEIPERYEVVGCIGRGAFGVVCSAITRDENGEECKVAIKKIIIREDNILEVKRLVREVYLLQHFDHDNIIRLLDIIEPPAPERFEEIYIVTDLMDTDLHHIIRSQQSLTEEHIQFFLYQVLRGLKSIHSASVLHRDLKPSNIVVNANCDLKICDFGLARELDPSNEMTDYVATRWYRAPELLMQWHGYSGAVDVWSVGCIFTELLSRKPLFPGKNYLDQLHLILDVVGSPTDEDINGIGSEKARNYLRQLKPKRKARDLHGMYPNTSEEAIDLISKMLRFDPRQRITAVEALDHPYFTAMHEPGDEPEAETFEFPFDLSDNTLTVFDLKDMLFRMLVLFHPELRDHKWWTDEEKAEDAEQKKERARKQKQEQKTKK